LTENDGVRIDLTGKNVLVTGGSMGIGYAAADACLAAGADAVISARTETTLREAHARLQARYPHRRVAAVTADAGVESDVERLFSECARNGALHGVVHAAGIYGPIGKITDVAPSQWLDAVRINLFGSFLVARAACNAMRESGGGRIVMLSGGGAATPLPNYTAYACAKIGVVRMVESVAQEMAEYGIEINALAPGFVATRLHEETLKAGRERSDAVYDSTVQRLQRGAIPASVAGRASAFLLGDAARGITGKFVAAPYDGWSEWPKHLEELDGGDLFTLRRILPIDRGLNWQ